MKLHLNAEEAVLLGRLLEDGAQKNERFQSEQSTLERILTRLSKARRGSQVEIFKVKRCAPAG